MSPPRSSAPRGRRRSTRMPPPRTPLSIRPCSLRPIGSSPRRSMRGPDQRRRLPGSGPRVEFVRAALAEQEAALHPVARRIVISGEEGEVVAVILMADLVADGGGAGRGRLRPFLAQHLLQRLQLEHAIDVELRVAEPAIGPALPGPGEVET